MALSLELTDTFSCTSMPCSGLFMCSASHEVNPKYKKKNFYTSPPLLNGLQKGKYAPNT